MSFSTKNTIKIGNFFTCGSLLLLIIIIIIVMFTCGSTFASSCEKPSLLMPRAEKSLILDLANAGQRTIGVGWRGHILISEDGAQSWQQVKAPTRRMLTSVYFTDELRGWAVGHGAVILGTEDGGQNWKLLSSAPEEERPLFDVIVTSDGSGFAIGAYAKFMTTNDGGKTWSEGEFIIEKNSNHSSHNIDQDDEEEPLPFDYHLNNISRSADGTFYIAAESGYLFRSDNNGKSWKELTSPYGGSFFGILQLTQNNNLLAYGLRGHIFRSEDEGQSWQQLETGTTALLTDAAQLPDGTVIITGMAGVLLVSSDQGRKFTLLQPNRISLTSVINTPENKLLVAGERGFKIVNKALFQARLQPGIAENSK
ncbi:MAG: hypothetical protein J7M09_05995 [Deltaproteobacteria bacterium]|nr:hypothetical protein [Candidatus Tharpella sp.]